MGVKVTNNAFGTISAGISTSDTTVTLDTGQGARFPALGSGDYFFGTLVDTSNNIEVVKVTARSTDSLTVTRAQDNTTARAFAIGDRFELRPTAALFEAILSETALADGDYGDITVSSSGATFTIDNDAVTTAKIDDANVTAAKLANTLDLSSKTVTLDKSDSALVHLATIDATPNAGTYEWSMDYDDFNEFLIIVQNIKGTSTSGSENLDGKFKINGTLDNGESNPYFITNTIEFSSVRNLNSTDNMEFMTTNLPTKHHSGFWHCTNFRGLGEGHPTIFFTCGGSTNSSSNYGLYQGATGMEVGSSASTGQVTAIRIAFTSGNVAEVNLEIYGYKR